MKKLSIKFLIIALIFYVGISSTSPIGLLRLDAYSSLNSPVTMLAQATTSEGSSANKVVIYAMDAYKIKVDGKESKIIPSHGEYIIRALEEGKVLANKEGENPEIIREDFGTELIDSKAGENARPQYEYSSQTDYYKILTKILEYAKSNPDKKIILLIGLQHYYLSTQEQELFKQLVDRGVIIVIGAGNDNSAGLWYPGALPGVINVAAIEGRGYIGYGEDKKVKKAGYSNYGRNVYIAADGSIELTKRVDNIDTVYRLQATEIAAARVSRLIAQMFIDNSALTVKDAFNIIRQAADPIEGIEGADEYYSQGLLGAGVVNYTKSLSSPEPRVTEPQPASVEKAKYISGPGFPFVRLLALAEIVVSGLVLIFVWSSYKEIEAYFSKISLKAKIFYTAVIVITVNWISNNGVALLYDICGKGLADYIMRQIWLGLYAEGILEITKIFISLFVLVLLIQGGRSVIGSIKSRNTICNRK